MYFFSTPEWGYLEVQSNVFKFQNRIIWALNSSYDSPKICPQSSSHLRLNQSYRFLKENWTVFLLLNEKDIFMLWQTTEICCMMSRLTNLVRKAFKNINYLPCIHYRDFVNSGASTGNIHRCNSLAK
jgi:hypothetical protein